MALKFFLTVAADDEEDQIADNLALVCNTGVFSGIWFEYFIQSKEILKKSHLREGVRKKSRGRTAAIEKDIAKVIILSPWELLSLF